jgi:glycosyltransferase involved in cell wall biosynthesis
VRVAVLTNFVPPYLRPVYQELAEQCGELTILLSALTEQNRQWVPDVRELPVVLQRTFSVTQIWKHPSGFAEAGTLHVPYDTLPRLMRYRPDVVIAGEMGFRSLQAWLYTLVNSSCRLVLWAKVSDVTERGRGWLRRTARGFLARRASAVIVNGKGGSRYIEGLGVPRSRIYAIPQTTDLRALSALPVEKDGADRKRLLYCGSLSERKGILPFLRCLARWCSANPSVGVDLDVVGHGTLRDSLATLPRPGNLRLRIRDNVAYEDLPSVYGSAGLYVFPTLADEWGMVITEAMAAGLPVIGSRFSQAVEELVQDEVTGWTFHPDREDDILGVLDRALNTPEDELTQMGGRARAAVAALTPSRIANDVLQVAATLHHGRQR